MGEMHPGMQVLDDFCRAPLVGNDHGCTHPPGLDHDAAKGFIIGREHDEVGGGKDGRHIVTVPKKRDVARKILSGGARFELSLVRCIQSPKIAANDQKMHVLSTFNQFCGSFQKEIVALPWRHLRNQRYYRCSRAGAQILSQYSGGVLLDVRLTNAVRNYGDALTPEPVDATECIAEKPAWGDSARHQTAQPPYRPDVPRIITQVPDTRDAKHSGGCNSRDTGLQAVGVNESGVPAFADTPKLKGGTPHNG